MLNVFKVLVKLKTFLSVVTKMLYVILFLYFF